MGALLKNPTLQDAESEDTLLIGPPVRSASLSTTGKNFQPVEMVYVR